MYCNQQFSHHTTLYIDDPVLQRDVLRTAAMGVVKGLALCAGETEEFTEHRHLHLLGAIVHLQDPYPPMVEVSHVNVKVYYIHKYNNMTLSSLVLIL